MQSAKEKVSNMASAAKEKIDIAKAKSQEKAEKAGARTEEERRMADEREKAKEAEAKADLHAAKARHAGEKMEAKQTHNVPGTAGIRISTAHHHIPGTGHHHDEYGSTYTTANKPVIGGTPAATMPGTTGATKYP